MLELKPTFIVAEATDGLEVPLIVALVDRQLPIVQINPRQARDFAKATGRLAKTDIIGQCRRRTPKKSCARSTHGVLTGAYSHR
jgi:transposase